MSEAVATIERAARFRPYPEYLDTGVSWQGEVPSHWEVARMKWTVTGCQNGAWGDEPDGVNDLACVRVADFDRTKFRVLLTEPTRRAIAPRVARSRLLNSGDLLIEKSGGGEKQLVGAVVLFTHDIRAVCSNFVARMPVADTHDSRFLCYMHAAAYSARLNLCSIKQNTGIQNLDSQAYLNEHCSLPPLDEQKTIADFLDRETSKIDALVAKKERLIELLQEKRTALITHAVTKGLDPNAPMKPSGIDWLGDIPAHWGTKRVKDVSRFVTSGSRGWAAYYSDEGAIFLRIGNLGSKSIDVDMTQLQHVQPPIGAEGERTRVRTGDVLVSITALIGAVGVVPDGVEEAYVNQHIALVRPSATDVEPRWLAYCAFSSLGQEQFGMDLYGGTKDGLGLDDVRSLRLLIPPISEQRRIVCHLDDRNRCFNSLIKRTKEGIEHLEEYRTALISAAATGKIDVREEVA